MFNKILLAEDNKDEVELFRLALCSVKADVGLASATGTEVMAFLHASAKPDIIFLDITMPVMDGWECLSAVKADPMFSDIPIIMCSSTDQEDAIEKSLSLGASAYLVKPATFNDLKNTLKSILAQEDIKRLRLAMKGYKGLYFPADGKK